jgi:hypothetical protein
VRSAFSCDHRRGCAELRQLCIGRASDVCDACSGAGHAASAPAVAAMRRTPPRCTPRRRRPDLQLDFLARPCATHRAHASSLPASPRCRHLCRHGVACDQHASASERGALLNDELERREARGEHAYRKHAMRRLLASGVCDLSQRGLSRLPPELGSTLALQVRQWHVCKAMAHMCVRR